MGMFLCKLKIKEKCARDEVGGHDKERFYSVL